jgi:hypothetical protein
MKAWVVVAEVGPDWLQLANEAYEFVRTGKPLWSDDASSLSRIPVANNLEPFERVHFGI